MRRILQWCRSRPWLSAVAGVGILGVSLHFFLNWRAERRWDEYCAEAQARGVKIWFSDFALPAIPDEQNFAALPMFRNLPAGSLVISGSAFALPAEVRVIASEPRKYDAVDWSACQAAFLREGYITAASGDPIRDTLRGLEHFAPQLQEWAEWRRRPLTRFPLPDGSSFKTISFPHLGVFLNASRVHWLKARAHLALHEPAPAAESFLDTWQGYHALEQEPTLIASVVRMAISSHVVAIAGEGVMRGVWTERELVVIGEKLAAMSLWRDHQTAIATERGYMNTSTMTLIRQSPTERARDMSEAMAAGAYLGYPKIPYSSALFALIPRRVYHDNLIRGNRYLDELLDAVKEEGTRYDFDDLIPSSPAHIEGLVGQFYAFFGGIEATIVTGIVTRTATLHTFLDQARIAVALERIRLRKGAYPADLRSLGPELGGSYPRDAFAELDYRYQLRNDGTYVLYGVGVNRVDDGGNEKLDLVWHYAPPKGRMTEP